MRISLYIFVLFFFELGYAQDYWIPRDSMNGPPRSASMSFVMNNEAWIIGGLDFEEFKRTMYSYDLDQDDWDDEEKMGGASGSGLSRASGIACAIHEKAYVGLGTGIIPFFNDLWEYDDELKVWSQKANFPGEGRREAICFSIDSTLYMGTGVNSEGLLNDFWKYEPHNNTWTQLNDFEGEVRRDAVGYKMGGKGYLGTGVGETGYLNDFWEYDPSTDTWNNLADFPGTPRHGAVGFGVFPNAYIALGEDNTFSYKKDVWEYNYFGNYWTQKNDFYGAPRAQAVAMVVDQRIFVGSGYNGQYFDDFFEYFYALETTSYDHIIQVYPNPSNGIISFKNLNNSTNNYLTIYDLQGRLIVPRMKLKDSSVDLNSFGNFAVGTYIIELESNDEKFIQKIKIL